MYETAQIDIARPAGRKLVRELETKKFVKMEYPIPAEVAGQKWHKHDDVWGEIEVMFNQHYGTNYKL
jgi:hypothetical protein